MKSGRIYVEGAHELEVEEELDGTVMLRVHCDPKVTGGLKSVAMSLGRTEVETLALLLLQAAGWNTEDAKQSEPGEKVEMIMVVRRRA